jgi:hypothetical protein
LPSLRRTLPVRLVIVRAIIVIVYLIALFLLYALLFSAPVFNPATCISTANDITQVVIVPTMPSPMLLQWSDTVTPIFYKKIKFANIGMHIGCISTCCAYEKPSKIKLALDALNDMAYYIFSKSLEKARRI